MLALPASMLNAIERHAQRLHPIECCGLVSTNAKGELRHIEMCNKANSETFFEFDPKEQLGVWRNMMLQDEELLLIYHSHTHSKPYPSRTDKEYAQAYPGVYQLIVATDERFVPSIRCYQINGEEVEEVPLNLSHRAQC